MAMHAADPTDREFLSQTVEIRSRLHRIAAGIVGDDSADDVVQTALLRTWRDRHRLSGRSCFARYATTVVRTAAIDVVRERQRRPSAPLDAATTSRLPGTLDRSYADPADPAEVVPTHIETDELIKSMSKLSPDEARLLYDHYGLGISYKELADNAGTRSGEVAATMRVALRNARRHHGRPIWVGSAPWAALMRHWYRAKAAFGAVPAHGALAGAVGIAACGIVLAIAVNNGSPSPSFEPVAMVNSVTSSSAPTPTITASQTASSPAPRTTTAPQSTAATTAPSVAPNTAPSSNPAPRSQIPTPSASAPIALPPAPTPAAKPSPTPAPTLASPTPAAYVATAVCAYRSPAAQVVAWRFENNGTRSYKMTSHSGILDIPAVEAMPKSITVWQQTDRPGSGSSWSLGAISRSLSAAQVAALPACGGGVVPAPLDGLAGAAANPESVASATSSPAAGVS